MAIFTRVMAQQRVMPRIYLCFKSSLGPALKTIKWLLSLMIPVSFVVMLLDFSGILYWLAGYTAPLVKMLGLRGEAALVLLSSGLLNIYSAIAVIQSIGFTGREITIMALMCLIAHNLIVETAIQKKTGSSAARMILLRIIMAVIGGYLLNLVLPGEAVVSNGTILKHSDIPFMPFFNKWLIDTLFLIGKVVAIILSLNFLHKLLDEFSITLFLSKMMSPVLRFFGLPPQVSFMWLIANIIGLGWGAAVLIEEAQQGRVNKQEIDTLNHHVAISHSLLEDTLLFAALGVAVAWIVFPRLFLAFIVVWLYKLTLKKS
ncbi:MAG: hypothetical protein Q8928_16445 [Bacteroidota bacterium]|nr:hypothetical protein [Bacteroidota bacterium]